MPRMPGTTWVGEKSPKKAMSRYDIVCIHTIVGRAPAHAAHFSTRGDGEILQSRDTKYRSGANLKGNHRIIAIENEDHGPQFKAWNVKDGHAVPAFTDAQIEAIAQICAWAHQTHGIPLVAAANSRPGSRGIAFHRQGIDGNWDGYRYGGRVSGGEVWTEARGKVCPGDRRIAQIPQIIARAKQIAAGGGTAPTPKDWFDMATAADLENAVRKVTMELYAEAASRGTQNGRNFGDSLKGAIQPFVLAGWLGSSGPTVAVALQSTYQQVREIAKTVGAPDPEVDVDELSRQLIAAVAPALVAAFRDELGDDQLVTEEQVEGVLRRVLGGLDE